MELVPVAAEGRQLIQGYRPGGFTIAGRRHLGSVLVLPDRTLPWAVDSSGDTTVASLGPMLEADPKVEILVLGSGASFTMVAPDLRHALRAEGIVVEAMDTRAACRTFNVLLAEDRRVGAALIAL
jgi:uncharacterized protein